MCLFVCVCLCVCVCVCMRACMYACMCVTYLCTVRGKYLEGENIGEFGEFVAIHEIFTLQMSYQIACKSKFAIFYYPKVKEMCIRQYFTPTNISRVHYMIYIMCVYVHAHVSAGGRA